MRRARRLTPRELEDALGQALMKRAMSSLVNNYVGGARTIGQREPDAASHRYSRILSADLAGEAGISTETALAHLVRLVAAGRLEESHRTSNVRSFLLPREQYDALARDLIKRLEAEGVPHDADWRAARAAAEPQA